MWVRRMQLAILTAFAVVCVGCGEVKIKDYNEGMSAPDIPIAGGPQAAPGDSGNAAMPSADTGPADSANVAPADETGDVSPSQANAD